MPEGVEKGVERAALQQAKEVRKSNNRSRCCCRRFASQSLEVGGERGRKQGEEGKAGTGGRRGGGGRATAPGHVQEEASQAPLGER